MLVVDKKATVSASAIAIQNCKKLMNHRDTPSIQKWIVNGLRGAEYLESVSEGHLFGYDKYVFVVEQKGKTNF